MANYETLKSAIQQVVKKNGNNEITGALLQQSLLAMINSLGAGYQFAGIATPTTNPGTPDYNVFYIAFSAGIYTNFGGFSMSAGNIGIIYGSGSTWAHIIEKSASAGFGLNLEIGTISGGVDADNPARARTAGYIKGPFIIDVTDGYVFLGALPYTLNPDGTYTYVGNWENYGDTGNNILLSNNYYYRLLFKRSDNANFSNTELGDIILRITKQTDAPIAKDVFSSFDYWKKIDTSGWLNAYVNMSLQVVSSTQSLCSQPIELEKGDVLFVETRNNYNHPIVIVPNANTIAVGDTLTFVDGVSAKINEHCAKQFIYAAKEKVFAVITTSKNYNRIYVFKNAYNLVSNTVKDRTYLLPDEAERKQSYYINSSNLWESGGLSVCFEVFSGGKATIKSNSSYNAIYALLKKSYVVPPSGSAYPLFMDGETGRHTVPVGASVDIAIPEDGYLYVYNQTVAAVNYYPDLVNIFCPTGMYVRLLNPAIADGYLNKGISAENVWRGQSTHLPASCYFNVKADSKVTIVANSSSYAIIAFLRNTAGGQDETANFANGTSGRTTITAGTSQTFGIIEDCLLYVYIQADTTTAKYIPDSISLYETETKPELTITRQAVNLAKTINLFTGVDNSGKLIADMSHVAVGPVLINNGGDWYKKARYIHACCYTNGAYAFNASKIVFLTDAKAVVSVETSVSSAVEIPETAYWAVVEFPYGSTKHFVGINNQSLLKAYSAYDEHNLVADSLPIYEKIQNTDGAISRMIDVALDYMPYSYRGMGYGDIATAFDDVVEPVESELPDTSPQHYDGEKLQMNCSTFVMLCLLGVFYKNSRYNTPNGKNIGDGYRFDEQAEYNYFYTKAPYQYIYGANFGKMYANKLAKYAFDRGLLYLIKPDLSNIEPGDVLFDGQTNDGNFFMNIGHTMFVVDVELKADGTKRVTIFETAAGSRVLVYGAEHYGARFPLPNRNIIFDNIVSGFEPISESVTANANTDVELGTYNLTKNIQSKKHYTLEIVGNLPDTVNVGIKGGTKTIEINRRELYKRGDGVNTKHFWFLMNDSVGISQITLYINSSSALSMEEITIDSLRISEGRFTL